MFDYLTNKTDFYEKIEEKLFGGDDEYSRWHSLMNYACDMLQSYYDCAGNETVMELLSESKATSTDLKLASDELLEHYKYEDIRADSIHFSSQLNHTVIDNNEQIFNVVSLLNDFLMTDQREDNNYRIITALKKNKVTHAEIECAMFLLKTSLSRKRDIDGDEYLAYGNTIELLSRLALLARLNDGWEKKDE